MSPPVGAPPPPPVAPPAPPAPSAPPGAMMPPPPGAVAPPPPGQQPPPPGYQPYQPGPGGPGFSSGNPATQFGALAGFWARLGGHLLDALIYGLAVLVACIPGIYFTVQAFDDCARIPTGPNTTEIVCVGDQLDTGSLALGITLIAIPVIAAIVVYLRALARTGQTVGRRIVGLKVINELTGAPPGWGKAIGRTAFANFISGQILWIGYLWMLWDSKKQTLHDKVAGTHVIRV